MNNEASTTALTRLHEAFDARQYIPRTLGWLDFIDAHYTRHDQLKNTDAIKLCVTAGVPVSTFHQQSLKGLIDMARGNLAHKLLKI
jgi:hypothetical protein